MKILSKNSTKSMAWKLVADCFVFIKSYAKPQLENEIFKTSWLYWIFVIKTVTPSQHLPSQS